MATSNTHLRSVWECDNVPWFFDFLTTLAPCLSVASYFVFSLVYLSSKDIVLISLSALNATCTISLAVAHGMFAIAFWYARNTSFRVKAVLSPILVSSVFGALLVLFCQAIRSKVLLTTWPIIIQACASSFGIILYVVLIMYSHNQKL
jgi:hypothetical protein